MSKPLHPILQSVKAYLEKEGISIQTFACSVLDYMPDSAKYIQGTGAERECTRAWTVQVWRQMQGINTPRKDRLLAYQNWLNAQQ